MQQRHFSLNWKVGLFTLVFLPLMVVLGFWQLDREAQKEALQSNWEARLGETPVTVDRVREMEDPAFVAVGLEGQYDVAHSFLLDNRTYQGRVGYEVITPLKTRNGRTVLINRGWVPQGASRQALPDLEPLPGHHTLVANVHVPDGDLIMLGEENRFTGWPRLMQQADPGRMYEELGIPAQERGLDHMLRLQENMPGELARNWQPVNTLPEKHRAYAVQWFAMATALLVLFLYSCFPRREARETKNGR